MLLIELQAAVEMAEDVSSTLPGRMGPYHKFPRVGRVVGLMMQSKSLVTQSDWCHGRGPHAALRLLKAIDATLAHGGVFIATDGHSTRTARACYCEYFFHAARGDSKSAFLRSTTAAMCPEALAACDELVGITAANCALQTRRRATEMAWLVAALRMRKLHGCLYDAAAGTAVDGMAYYTADSIFLEPNDYGRLLWFAKRIDALDMEPPIDALRRDNPELFAYCSSHGNKHLVEPRTPFSPPPRDAHPSRHPQVNVKSRKSGDNDSSIAIDKSMDVVLACQRRIAIAATLETRSMIVPSRVVGCSQGHSSAAAIKVNYLLRHRPTSESLIARGIIRSGAWLNIELARRCELLTEPQLQIEQGCEQLEKRPMTAPYNAGHLDSSRDETQAATYYRIWLLQATTVGGEKRVVPISRDSVAPPYARKRFRDFWSLREALVTSTGSSVRFPGLPPRRFPRTAVTMEKRRAGLEEFLTALLTNPCWRHSHELGEFLTCNILEPCDSDLNIEAEDEGNSSSSDHEPNTRSLLGRDAINGITPSRAPPWSPSANDEIGVNPQLPSPIRTMDLVSAPFIAAAALVAPKKVNKRTMPPIRQPDSADWRKLRRVEHRCYVFLRVFFEIERLGLLRRNFLALIRRVTITLWSPSLATWLGDQAKREHKVGSLSGLIRRLNGILWQNSCENESSLDPQSQAVIVAILRRDLVAAVPSSFISLLGQKATEDAADKLLELVLCPIQLRSAALTFLDLAIAEIFPELELEVAGMNHLA